MSAYLEIKPSDKHGCLLVVCRTEGSVSESYLEPEKVAVYLQSQSLALRDSWPLGDALPLEFDLTLDIQGWT